ncbi:MAG: hypothetical protein A2068_13090 [Ignavibacteria bacterium GWB2_35_6b]|nr:MAG: hypothetical protein A2068_13090 [Ignavibacteria bacterium GWB2_35_6b]
MPAKNISELLEELEKLKRESEYHIKLHYALIDMSPEAIVLHVNGIIQYANKIAAGYLGYESGMDLVGKPILDLVPEEYLAEVLERIKRSEAGEELPPLSMKFKNPSGTEHFFESTANVINIDGKRVVHLFIKNLTTQKQAELELVKLNRALKAISAVNHTLIRSTEENQFLIDVCKIVCGIGGYMMCWVGYKIDDEYQTIIPVAWEGEEQNYLHRFRISWGDNDYGNGPMGIAIRTGLPYVMQNLIEDITDPEWKEAAIGRGYNSILALPLITEGNVFGAIGFYSERKDAFDKEETELLQQLAADLSYGIISLRIREEQKKAEHALIESEHRYREIFENDITGDFVISPEGKMLSCNSSFARIFGFNSAEDVAVCNFGAFYFHEEEFKFMVKLLEKEKKLYLQEVILKRNDGKEIHAIQNVVGSFDENGELIDIKGYLIDDTERKRAEDELRNSREQLRNLAAYLQRAREEERTHVAREIHDELGQSLTALKMDIALLQDIVDEKIPENLRENLTGKIYSASGLIDETVKTVRKISTDLRPAVLDNLGLLPAIDWQAEEFQNRTGINCETFITIEEIDLAQEYQTAVFRILQESLTNVMRHAAATLVTIEFRKDEDILVLEIKDNGKGISESNMQKVNSFGLIGIKERAYVFGGDAIINGIPGKGTSVLVKIPLK